MARCWFEVCFSKQPCWPMCTAPDWHVHAAQVNAEAQKIGKEADEANAIAAECQAGLDKALPALQAAEDALNVLTKKDMSELKVQSPEIPPSWHLPLNTMSGWFQHGGQLTVQTDCLPPAASPCIKSFRSVGSYLCCSALSLAVAAGLACLPSALRNPYWRQAPSSCSNCCRLL